MYVLLFLSIIVFRFIYRRYMPVFGVSNISGNVSICNKKSNNIIIVDARDFQTSSQDMIKGSQNIPLAYIRRQYVDIPSKRIIVIASDAVEKNLSIRFLQKKGFTIVGYSIRKEQVDNCNYELQYASKKNSVKV
ncbi:rhodanese-like domain-containing protein [Salirhabdus salicampi]|uniref:rhodanese-like domain-containing protein n=1 Tax=Salirhabdus salicampi TaxID=476102 RepID=UPI0020C22F41|nr:rhodanese-like domain-containing protein [Salirhabdus salicampi]MCP8615397.1 hypothetical protein [Salirhabdus salicampi]